MLLKVSIAINSKRHLGIVKTTSASTEISKDAVVVVYITHHIDVASVYHPHIVQPFRNDFYQLTCKCRISMRTFHFLFCDTCMAVHSVIVWFWRKWPLLKPQWFQ